MATENSDAKIRPPRVPSVKNLKTKKMSTSDGTNTMDFIEKMINQDVSDDFKIPEYEGIQTSLMKNS